MNNFCHVGSILKQASIVFLLSSLLEVTAQTGPAGVGNVTSNVLWLKADAGTSSTVHGTAISTWNDQSGNANHAAQATAAQRPLYNSGVINGRPAIFFDNASTPNNDLLVIPDNINLDNTAGLSIFTLTRPTSLNNSGARAIVSKRVDVSDNQAYTLFFYNGGDKLNIDVDGMDNRFTTATGFVSSRDYAISLIYDGSLAAASRSKVYVNETLDVTHTETSASIPNHASNLTIGSLNVGDGRPFGGYIGEVIILNKAVNLAERLIIHNYLFAKYGLNSTSVPATTNELYAGDEAVNGDYDLEVAGVGTDASGSNLAASSSIAGGLGITQVSGFQNGDYLLYGHTVGSNFATASDVGGMTGTSNGRWNRIWYLDVTNAGADQVVDLVFDMSDGGTPVTPVTAANYVLLRRAGLSGNWTELTTASSIVGDQLNFPGITVASDAYYTLGSKDYINSPLPVRLVDFAGTQTVHGVELRWSTATEWNNDFFTIERSEDGETFEHVGDLNATGISYKQVSYTMLDPDPFPEKTYYRLKQTDFNGDYAYLKTIRVSTENHLIRIYPNPASDKVMIDLKGRDIEGVDVKVYDSNGSQVFYGSDWDHSILSVRTSEFPAGLYLFKVFDGSMIHTFRVVVR